METFSSEKTPKAINKNITIRIASKYLTLDGFLKMQFDILKES